MDSTESDVEFSALLNAFRRPQGFGLFFVECRAEDTISLVQRLQQAIPDSKMVSFAFEHSGEDVRILNRVRAIMHARPEVDSVLIYGMENLMSLPIPKSKTHPVLYHLNQQRERFRDLLSVRIVFFLAPAVLTRLIKEAPDFFDWRSGLFQVP